MQVATPMDLDLYPFDGCYQWLGMHNWIIQSYNCNKKFCSLCIFI